MPRSEDGKPIEIGELPSWAWVAALLANTPTYAYLTFVRGDSFRGLAGASAGFVIVLLMIGYWPLRRRLRFWAIVSGLALFHALLVWSLPAFRYRGPGMAFYPLMVFDILICMKLLDSQFSIIEVEEPYRLTSTEVLEGDPRAR